LAPVKYKKQIKNTSPNSRFGVRRGVIRGTLYKYFASSVPVPTFAKPRPTAKPPGVVGKPTRQGGGHRAKTAELQHNNNFKKKIMLQFCNLDRVMESETIGKNGASPKSLTSKRNFLKRFALLSTGLFVFGRRMGAQNTETEVPMKISYFRLYINTFEYEYPEEYQEYLKNYLIDHPNPNYSDYLKDILERGNLGFTNAQNPITFQLEIQVNVLVKIKYSLYTYKKTFSQDGKRNYWQGIVEPGLVKPLTTQTDIDKALDKIYEFPVVTEISSGYKELSWDGYTDPKFTSQKYSVRDCLYMTAHNADTGELMNVCVFQGSYAQIYTTGSTPGIVYRIDEHKDSNGKVIKETLSGKVIVAYPDDWLIKNVTALITIDSCGYGALTFDVINQGADAIVADINKRIPGDVVAHITLTNPTVDKNNKDIKIFDWKDIKTEDGKDFIPDIVNNPYGYKLAIIVDMDEMTFTGIKNGSIVSSISIVPPVPKSYTGIETFEKSDINITSDETNFVVLCPAGVSANSYAVYDLGGNALKTGNLSGLSRETISATELRSGIYFVQLTIKENGEEKVVTKKVLKQ